MMARAVRKARSLSAPKLARLHPGVLHLTFAVEMRVLRRGDRIHGGLPFAKGPTTVLLAANVPVERGQSDKTSYGCRRAPASNSASTENKKLPLKTPTRNLHRQSSALNHASLFVASLFVAP